MNIFLRLKSFLAENKKTYLFVLMLAGFLVLLKFILVSIHHGYVLDSDKVAQFLLLKDLFTTKIFFPPDSFLLQFPVYFLVQAIFGYSQWTIVTVTFIHLVVCFFGFAILYFTLFPKKAEKIVYFLPLMWIFSQSELFFYYVGYPSSRGLEVGLYCIFIALLVKVFSEDIILSAKKWLFWIILVVLSFMFFSDPYWGYMLTIPTLFIYALVCVQNRKFKYISIPILLAAVLFIAVLLRWILGTSSWFFFYSSDAIFVDYSQFLKNLTIFFEGFLQLFDAFFFRESVFSFSGITKICNLLLVVMGIYGLWRLFIDYKEKKLWYGIFLITFVVTISSYIFSSKIIDIGSTRYLLLVPFLLTVGLQHLVIISGRVSIYILAPLLSLALLFNISASGYLLEYVPFDSVNGQSTTIVNLLESKNLQYGYGNYWFANVNTFLSQEKVKIRQVVCSPDGNVTPFKWLSADSWYHPGAYTGDSFLITERNGGIGSCSSEKINKQFGDSSSSYDLDMGADKIRILVYPYNIASKF